MEADAPIEGTPTVAERRQFLELIAHAPEALDGLAEVIDGDPVRFLLQATCAELVSVSVQLFAHLEHHVGPDGAVRLSGALTTGFMLDSTSALAGPGPDDDSDLVKLCNIARERAWTVRRHLGMLPAE